MCIISPGSGSGYFVKGYDCALRYIFGKVVYLGEQVESRWVLDSRTLRLLQLTAEFFGDERQQAFLVGGSLRNILLGEPCDDWDIVTTGDAPTLARQLADKLGGFYAYLHEKACRVVVPALTMPKDEGEVRALRRKMWGRLRERALGVDAGVEGGQEVVFDISSLKGHTLEHDLRQRDFTVNAIAAPLVEIVPYIDLEGVGIQGEGESGYTRGALPHFIDPLHGWAILWRGD